MEASAAKPAPRAAARSDCSPSFVPPAALLRPRLECREASPRGRFTAVADAPLRLDAAVDADEDAERFSAVPPAEVRAGDDPGVLVEPVTLVGGRCAAARRQPGVEAPGAGGQGDLVERLGRRARHVECGRS